MENRHDLCHGPMGGAGFKLGSAAGLTNPRALRIFFRVMKIHPPGKPAMRQSATSKPALFFRRKQHGEFAPVFCIPAFTSVISSAIAAVTV